MIRLVFAIHSINADIEIIKAQLRKTEVLAPFDGLIGLRTISIGAEVHRNGACHHSPGPAIEIGFHAS